MATYLQGQQDYVTQIQPTQPNLQFDAQMLGNLQNKYDAGHKKVSELYGSLLNAAMTRTDNIQARNEFFQMINEDIRRMGSLDFSLQQNVDAAANVFQSIYTNKGIVKDMVWTRNYQQQMNKRNSLKNCNDPEKCGGSAWDIGDRAMAYRREAFQNATADEALAMGNVEYVPQQNMMKDAVKLAKEADLNVTIDKITGKYRITTRNGDLIKSPLTTLFSETFAKDQKYRDMYKTQAYVARQDWSHNKVKTGEFANLDEAQVGYLQDYKTRQQQQLEKSAKALDMDLNLLDKKIKDETDAYNNGEFKQNSDRAERLVELRRLQSNAASAKQYTQSLIDAEKSTNPEAAFDVLAANVDNQQAYQYMNNDITAAVRTLAFRDAEQTLTADEFAKLDEQHKNKLSEMAAKFEYDTRLQSQKDAASLERTKISASGADVSKQNTINTKFNNISKAEKDMTDRFTTKQMDLTARSNSDWKSKYDVNVIPVSENQLNAWRNSNKAEDKEKVAFYNQLLAEEENKKIDTKKNAVTDFIYEGGKVSQNFANVPYPSQWTKQQLLVSAQYPLSSGQDVSQNFTKQVADFIFNGDFDKADEAIYEVMSDKTIDGSKSIIEEIRKRI